MSSPMPGGWTAFSFTLTEDAMTVFKKALEGFVGVGYAPLAFASQVVAGVNYCFLCKGQIVYPDAPEIAVKLYVYAPLKGSPHITEIMEIKP